MDAESARRAIVRELQGRAVATGSAGIVALVCGAGASDRERAAADLAAEVGADVFLVDLSRVVSKYVGETEKNLDRALSAAELADSILLMDEADALFGKSTQVAETRAERRRVANRAWSVLTRRPGLCLLSVASPTDLDPVIRGRIRYALPVAPGTIRGGMALQPGNRRVIESAPG
jgi:SpoVK/Ycf46/Vps4 family AAA+-type ATPase